MKKLFLITALIITSLAVNAQDGLKGTWFAGGQLSFGSSTVKNHSVIDGGKIIATGELKNTNTTVLPIVGTFVSPSVAIGAGVGYMGEKDKFKGEQISKADNFVIKPLVRKYWNISGGLFFYGQAALPMIFGSGEATAGEGKFNTTNIGLELSPGFDYVINSWLTIETSFTILNTGFTSFKPKGGEKDSSFGFNANPFNSVSDRKVGDLQVGVKFLF